jgi:hypothetical protein
MLVAADAFLPACHGVYTQAQGPDARKKSFDTEGLLYHYLEDLLHSMHWVMKLGMNN